MTRSVVFRTVRHDETFRLIRRKVLSARRLSPNPIKPDSNNEPGHTQTMDMPTVMPNKKMPLKKIARSVMLASLSVALLSGCVEDNYDYGDGNGNGGGGSTPKPTKIYKVYGDSADGWFPLYIVDKDDNKTAVPDSGDSSSLNITTTPVSPGTSQGPLLITVDNGQPGTILTQASTPIDLTTPANAAEDHPDGKGGTLQFYLRPGSKTLSGKKVAVTLPTPEGVATEVDITTAFNAFVGAGNGDNNNLGQQLKIPVSCFTDLGVDFSSNDTPFSLTSESNADFELANIRLRAETSKEKYVLPCSWNSEILDEENSNIFTREPNEVDGGWTRSGWANNVSTYGPAKVGWPPAGQVEGKGGVTVKFPDAEAGQTAGLILAVDSDKDDDNNVVYSNKDISRYLENGVLSFDLYVVSYATHPTQVISVKMNTDAEFTDSLSYKLEPGLADLEWKNVQIPLRDLFTAADGRVDAAAIGHIQKPLVIAPEAPGEGNTLNGMEIAVNNVRLLMNP